jgi:hypothetical protein
LKETLCARSFLILTLVFSLLSGGILNATGIDTFAKKIKTSSSNRVNGLGSGSRDEGSGTTSDSDKQGDEWFGSLEFHSSTASCTAFTTFELPSSIILYVSIPSAIWLPKNSKSVLHFLL